MSKSSKAPVQYSTKPEFDCRETVERLRRLRAERLSRKAPPVSNTGGKSPTSTAAAAVPEAAHVDTLTFTLVVDHLFDLNDPSREDDAILRAVEDIFLNGVDLEAGEPTGRKLNGYQDSAPIKWAGHDIKSNGKAVCGFIAWGGNRNKMGQDTLCVHLTGQGCEHVNLLDAMQGERWSGIRMGLEMTAAKITRIDIAYDDLEGERGGIGAAVGWYKDGSFSAGGRQPSVNQAGDWINGHSRTLYVGRRENGKLVRVYEKGHQLGDAESPWVRYELELHSRDRVIPFDALVCPTRYLAGSSPAMEWVSKVSPVPIVTVVCKRLLVTLDHLQGWASVSYGRLINAMTGVGMSAQEIVDTLRVDGLPRRLFVPPAAAA